MPFDDIAGQERPKAVLRRTIEKGRVPHAFLFHGIRGIGKFETALVFAAALNCAGPGGDACGSCPSCVKMKAGNHPDVFVFRPDGAFIRLAAIRELQHQIQFRPYEGKRKVFLLDEAERMNEPAANALLKTLEEPLSGNVLILVSSRPYRLPRTVFSRCQPLRFDPLPEERIALFLEETHSAGPEEARIVAASSGGSMERALEALREDHRSGRKAVVERIASCMEKKDPLDLFALPALFGETRPEVSGILQEIEGWCRDMLVFKEQGPAALLTCPDLAGWTARASRLLTGKDILNAVAAVRKARESIEQNANRQLTLESMLFKLVTL